jgi:hypothetical protein
MDHSEEREQEATDALVDDAAEIGEEALAVLTQMEVLEHIPIVKLGVAVAKAARSLRDQALLKKLLTFLRGLSSVTRAERVEMIRRLSEDAPYSESVGEHLIELLDRLDSRRKALMTAAVFAAFARQQINRAMLYRLTHAVESILLIDLPAARNLTEEGYYLIGDSADAAKHNQGRAFQHSSASLESLSAAGLVHAGSAWGGMSYDLTDVGRAFIDQLRLDLIPYK